VMGAVPAAFRGPASVVTAGVFCSTGMGQGKVADEWNFLQGSEEKQGRGGSTCPLTAAR
jgi:hypothetical protein